MNEERAILIHIARVYITQAAVFRARNPKPDTFALTLLDWAAKKRRAAAAMDRNEQRGLFR